MEHQMRRSEPLGWAHWAMENGQQSPAIPYKYLEMSIESGKIIYLYYIYIIFILYLYYITYTNTHSFWLRCYGRLLLWSFFGCEGFHQAPSRSGMNGAWSTSSWKRNWRSPKRMDPVWSEYIVYGIHDSDSWFMMSIYTLSCVEEGLKLWSSSTHVASSPAVGYHLWFPEKTAKVHQLLISWYLSSNLWWAIWQFPSFSINFPLHSWCPWGQSAKNQSLSGPGGTGRSDAGHDGFDGQDGQRRGRFRAGILRDSTPQRLEVLKKILWVFHIVPVWISISHIWYLNSILGMGIPKSHGCFNTKMV